MVKSSLLSNTYLLTDLISWFAHEEDGNKDIVKRVIGMPGTPSVSKTINFYINDKETDEPYLADYIKRFKDDKLQSTYSGKGFEGNKGTSLEVLLKSPSLYSWCQL